MLVLGGGGYTIRNVARCWCYETACCCNVELPDQVRRMPSAKCFRAFFFAPSFLDRIIAAVLLCMQLPFNDYYDYYGPDFQLHIAPSNMENLNHDKCAFPRNYLKTVHARIAGTCTPTSRRFSPTSGELSSTHRMSIALTNSSAVSVYAPSGNTGGVEVHIQPK